MTSAKRLLLRLLLFAFGLSLGVFYAWKVAPIRYVDVPLSALRADYRTDYVMSIAEAYAREQNLEQVTRRLSLLGPAAPLTYVQEALLYAQQHEFSEAEIALLQALAQALENPAGEGK